MISWSVLSLLFPLVSAYTLGLRNTEVICDQYSTVAVGQYSLLANQWGKSEATSGSQCTTLEAVNGDSVSWYTRWNWVGGTEIKSFSNIQVNVGLNQQLSAISSMKSSWHWSQRNTGTVIADVAYDFLTSSSPGGSRLNELMIWLASFGNAAPISYNCDSQGNPVPIATDIVIADHSWSVYHGNNGYNEVYSFLPGDGSVTTFNADVYGFFTYLISAGYIQSSEYLVVAQGGTEATSGNALFYTQEYSLIIE